MGGIVMESGVTTRPTWTDTFLSIARTLALRSTCPRLAVGAVIHNDDNHILATGYNGSPRGLSHCSEVGCEIVRDNCVRAVHGEVNAILQAARIGVSIRGAHLVLTHTPCIRCALSIVQVGLASVTCAEPYRNDDRNLGLETLHTAGVRIALLPVSR